METMKLAQLIAELEKAKPEQPVYFDFCEAVPMDFDSWRGSYSQLALGFRFPDLVAAPRVGELLDKCRAEIGRVRRGYKGGEFCMGLCTQVWIDKWGTCSLTGLVGVVNNGSSVILQTARLSEDAVQ